LSLQAASEDEESSEEPPAAAAAASASALEKVALLPGVPGPPSPTPAAAAAADGGLEGPFFTAAAADDGAPDSVDTLLQANRDVVEAGKAAAAALAARPQVGRWWGLEALEGVWQ
jgi:hypothetical protein